MRPVPDPVPHGKLIICPVPGCNRRFTKDVRYQLHYRVAHQEKEQG